MPSTSYKVRILDTNSSLIKGTLKWASRLYLPQKEYIALTGGLDGGKPCLIETISQDGNPGQSPIRREATLWISPDKNLSHKVVQMTAHFQEACGFHTYDLVKISLSGETVADAESLTLRELQAPAADQESVIPPVEDEEKGHWEWLSRIFLGWLTKLSSLSTVIRLI